MDLIESMKHAFYPFLSYAPGDLSFYTALENKSMCLQYFALSEDLPFSNYKKVIHIMKWVEISGS